MKAKIIAFIENLILYDYILFGGVFVLFILFIILGIVLRKKIFLAVLLILLAFAILILGPTLGYQEMHKFLFKNATTITSQKKLEFTQAIVVKGTLKNESKFNFSTCRITTKVHKVSKNEYKNYLYAFKTIQKASILEENIVKGQTINFKLFIEPFTYSKDYNLSIGAKCK